MTRKLVSTEYSGMDAPTAPPAPPQGEAGYKFWRLASMFQDRNLKADLVGLALIALTLFLAVAITSYDPADPVPPVSPPLDQIYSSDVPVYPTHGSVQNACGRWGSLIADMMFSAIGWGAYYVLLSLAALSALLLQRRTLDSPAIRFLGWAMSLAGATTLLTMLIPHWSPGPVVGSGGYLGALLEHMLLQHFAWLGGLILCLTVIVAGLLLSTDYMLLRGLTMAWLAAHQMVRQGFRLPLPGQLSTSVRKTRHEPAEVAGDLPDEEETADEVAIRIRGKKSVRANDIEDVEDEDELAAETSESWKDRQEIDDDDFEEEEDLESEEEQDEFAGSAGPPSVRHQAGGKKVRADREDESSGPRIRKRGVKSGDPDLALDHLDEAARGGETPEYELPSIDLLVPGDDICFEAQEKEIRRKAKILEQTFADFGFQVKVVEIETGPVIAQYEVQLEAGLRLSKITGLADDLAIALRVPSVRIVAPIPGKNTVGIEVPNNERQVVRLREVLEESNGKTAKMRIPLFLGKDVSGSPLTVDLSTLPHLLIAGRTGTGKSVCLNAIISSILMTKRPDEVRMLMIDPKMVELSGYARLPHLMHPVVTDMKKAEAILAWAVDKMEERYALLARAGVRHISSYNQLSEEELMERLQPDTEAERQLIPLHLPFIVIVADEIADLMMTSGKEVEQHIIRLAQKSRAVGIHLILATQKPTVDVITGLIKSNLPARISFQVASRTDSRVVLDEMGADKLLGNGDMLFLWPGTSTLLRGQGTYLGDDEIDRMVEFVSRGEQNFVNELVNIQVADEEGTAELGDLKKRDELYQQAVEVILREGRGSVSLLQRALGIGYGRAARLIDFMEEDSIVGPYAGSQAREILITFDDWERMRGVSEPIVPPANRPPLPARRSNKIRPHEQGWDDDEVENQRVAEREELEEEADEWDAAETDEDGEYEEESEYDEDGDEDVVAEYDEEEIDDEIDEDEEEEDDDDIDEEYESDEDEELAEASEDEELFREEDESGRAFPDLNREDADDGRDDSSNEAARNRRARRPAAPRDATSKRSRRRRTG